MSSETKQPDQAVKELLESQERYKLVVQGTRAGVWDWMNVSGDDQWWSPRFYELLGYKDQEIEATLENFSAMLHPDDEEATFKMLEDHFKQKKPFEIEYRLKTKSGDYKWFLGSGQAQWDDEGNPIRMVGTIIDIHDRKMNEKARQENHAKFEALFNNAAVGVALLGLDSKPKKINKALEHMLGYSSKELCQMPFAEFTHPEDVENDIIQFGELLERQYDHYQVEKRYITKDDRVIWGDLSVSLLTDENNNAKNAIAVIRDITEYKNAQKEIVALNKALAMTVDERTRELETANKELEAFTYSISHDLRSPLRGIVGFSQALKEEYYIKLDEEGKHLVDVVLKNGRKMGQLIDDLLDFSRMSRKEKVLSTFDMTYLVNDSFNDLMKNEEKDRNVELTVKELPDGYGDMKMIRQVITNLLSNAIKFSGGKDLATIEVSAEQNGEGITYMVKDNGVGFDMSYAKNLFGVFQRLHHDEEFKGTGVGLAICHRIITRHGGEIWAKSRPGQGATFNFTLPGKDFKNG